MMSKRSFACSLLAMAVSFAAHAQSVKSQISFPQTPLGIAVNPLTNLIYVAAPSYGGATDSIAVIDGKSDSITKQITVPRGAQFPVADFSQNRLYVVGCDTYSTNFSCLITSINTKTNKVLCTETITTTPGDGILATAYDVSTGTLYLANGSNSRIDVVNTSSLQVIDSISTNGLEPFGLSFNPFNHRLYATYYSDQVQVFDVRTKASLAVATVGTQDYYSAVNLVTGNVFVTDNLFGPSTTAVLDQDGKLITQIPVSTGPANLDVDPFTNKTFVLSTNTPALNVIDGSTNTVSATLPNVTGSFIAVNVGSGKVYISGASGITVVSEK